MGEHKGFRTDMLSVDEALERILAAVDVLDAEEQGLLEAMGQVLAEDVVSPLDIPAVPNSAMDGYAVVHQDILGASESSPIMLPVIEVVQAGRMPRGKVGPGIAMRIMTGAPIPEGADTIVPLELTDEAERIKAGRPLTEIAVRRWVPRGAHVRPAGEDVRRGDVVLRKGAVVRPAEIGVLASLGMTRINVVRRPQVAILATGNEVVRPGRSLKSPAHLYDSNSFTIAAGILRCGGMPRLLGVAPDNLEAIHRKLAKGLEADMLITSAGVSKGERDLVKDVVAELGEIAFWSVRIRPGKPLVFGLLRAPDGRKVPHVGLPGNPVSAMVAFEELVRPAILKMMGRTHWARPTIEAVMEDPIANTDGRRVYARAQVTRRDGTYYARLTGPQGSHVLTSTAKANGLAICPEEVLELKAGQKARVRMVDWNEDPLL